MAVFTEEQRRLTRKLITSLTGFTSGEENFSLCFRFCKSNFRFHRFLCVNDMDVGRAIDGLEEKFLVHSLPDTAHNLRRLTESFLEAHLEQSFPRSDAHYGVLSLLFCLSQSPLHVTFKSSLPILPPSEEVEWFDWTRHLMEDIEFSPIQSSDSEWSDSESEEEPTHINFRDESSSISAAAHIPSSHDSTLQGDGIGFGDKLLEQVSVPYWEDRYQTLGIISPCALVHPACYLAEIWEDYLKTLSPLYAPNSELFLSEWQIVRETVWLLVGAEESFIYNISKNQVRVREGIRVSHLTPLALYSVLEDFAAVATKLHHMRQFCCAVLMGVASYVWTHTYEAFVSGLQRCLTHLLQTTRNIEEDLVLKIRTLSLLRLREEESVTFDLVEGIYSMFQQGIPPSSSSSSCSPDPSPTQCTTRLLDTLWAWLESCDMLSVAGHPLMQLLLPLWLEVTRPYMDMLHIFVTTGNIIDQCGEFCIVRNLEVEIKHSNYWEELFVSRDEVTPTFLKPIMNAVMVTGKSLHLMKNIGIGKIKKSQHTSSREGVVNKVSPVHKLNGTTPITVYQGFLRSLLEYCSERMSPPGTKLSEPMTLDTSLLGPTPSGWTSYQDRRPSVSPSHDSRTVVAMSHDLSPASLMSLSSDHDLTAKKTCNMSHDSLRQPVSSRGTSYDLARPVTLSCEISHDSSSEDEHNLHYDVLMRAYLCSLDATPPNSSPAEAVWSTDACNIMKRGTLSCPINLLIQNCIFPHLQHHHDNASQTLVELLRSEFDVSEHIHLLQEFFLMKAGATIHHFTHLIFQKELSGDDEWCECGYMNAVLDEALHYLHPTKVASMDSLERRLSLAPPPDNSPFLASISLHYAVPWPLTVLFPDSVMARYSEIFQFLLHVRWCKWSLEGIVTRNTSSVGEALAFKTHLLLLLRNKLLFFVNYLNIYLMTRIMDGAGVDFQQSIAMATDLEVMIQLHSAYLQSQYDRCFLSPQVCMVHQAVVNVLKLGVQFRRSWERGIVKFDVREAKRMEEELTRCCHFLVSCFNKTAQRGIFLHLEMLSFSLIPLKKGEKIFSPHHVALLEA